MVDLAALPAIPRDAGGPVFREQWEAQAFAMVVELHQRGLMSWREWSERLACEIRVAQAGDGMDDGSRYYEHWLTALEKLVAEKALVGKDELARRKHEWDQAARATPHGQPIELRPGSE